MSFLRFDDAGFSPSGKTRRVTVANASTGAVLGWLSWFPRWRRYCFAPAPHTVFDATCLEEIGAELAALMDERAMRR